MMAAARVMWLDLRDWNALSRKLEFLGRGQSPFECLVLDESKGRTIVCFRLPGSVNFGGPYPQFPNAAPVSITNTLLATMSIWRST
jgi:hypothetical protein